jgi:hypothetical protein
MQKAKNQTKSRENRATVKRCKHEPYLTHDDEFKCCACKRKLVVIECEYCAFRGVKCRHCGSKRYNVRLKGRK